MTMRGAAIAAMCVATAACTRTLRDSSLNVPTRPPERATGVSTTMRQQVVNAVVAGTGDPRVTRLRQRLAVNPADVRARIDLAALYRQSGFPDLALEHYRMAADHSPDSAEIAVLLARTLSDQQLPVEARRHLQMFTVAHPDAGAEAWSWLGILEDGQGDFAAGERSHRAALRLRSGSDALHNNLGYNLLLQGRNSEAAVEFRKALEISPESALARSNLGIAVAENPVQAVREWQTVTDVASAHNNLAAVLMERGDYEGARRELESALGFRKDHPAALRNLQFLADANGGSLIAPSGRPESPWRRFVRSLGIVVLGPETGSGQARSNRTDGSQSVSSGTGAQ